MTTLEDVFPLDLIEENCESLGSLHTDAFAIRLVMGGQDPFGEEAESLHEVAAAQFAALLSGLPQQFIGVSYKVVREAMILVCKDILRLLEAP